MIISDLEHLEILAEETGIVGGTVVGSQNLQQIGLRTITPRDSLISEVEFRVFPNSDNGRNAGVSGSSFYEEDGGTVSSSSSSKSVSFS